ncbi:MAG: hypothetical protein KDB29_12610 [Planctomycetes bacterium]|nr:hypothetical protein [Planctomycetota bacterium]
MQYRKVRPIALKEISRMGIPDQVLHNLFLNLLETSRQIKGRKRQALKHHPYFRNLRN